MAGGTALTVSLATGTASAHKSKFFGCKRVASGTDGDLAVVTADDGYECRRMENRGPSDDVPWDWDAHTYIAGEDEAIVGVIAEDEVRGDDRVNEGCWLCLNPNTCAEAHYDTAEQIRDELDTAACGPCGSDVSISEECEPASAPAADETTVSTASSESADGVTGEPEEFAGLRQLRRLFRRTSFGFWR